MESLFQCGGFLDRQIGMEPLVIDLANEAKKKRKWRESFVSFMSFADYSIFKSIMS